MEMQKLMDMLDEAKIPYEVHDCHGTPQICYPVGPAQTQDCVCDVICHSTSYGGRDGLLEIMGLVPEDFGDTVEGWLTATDVFERIKAHFETKTVYIYERINGIHTAECNQNIDYIVRNLPGVTVTAEKGELVQIIADRKAEEVINFLADCDLMVMYKI